MWLRDYVSVVQILSNHCTKNEVFHSGFFSNCDQIQMKFRISSYLLKKPLMENFLFCAVNTIFIALDVSNCFQKSVIMNSYDEPPEKQHELYKIMVNFVAA